MERKILVTGSTGAQGGAVLRFLVSKGLNVRALVRQNDKTAWFKEHNIETTIGNFEDRESLLKALDGITNVSLVYPLNYDWELIQTYTDNLIYAFKKHNLESIVFNTSSPIPPFKQGSVVTDMKLHILERFTKEELPIITLSPSFYLDNLTAPWSLPVIKEHGYISYPLPSDAPFAWLSHYNLAQFTYKAILNPKLIGKTFLIGGELLTGNQIAEKLSEVLGKPIQYSHLKPFEFKQKLVPQFGEQIATEIASSYQQIESDSTPFKNFYNTNISEDIFGVKLQSFSEWVKTISWN